MSTLMEIEEAVAELTDSEKKQLLRHLSAQVRHSQSRDRTWVLPVVALGEYRYGLLKSNRRKELESWLAEVEKACVVLVTDAVTAQHDASSGRTCDEWTGQIPHHELWSGALALQHGMEVVSRDFHFDIMPGVRRVGW